MLDSLFIRNFRLFKSLEIERLSRVNLIVGKNNSGKSCFLEAICAYISDGLPDTLFGLIEQRNDQWETEFGVEDEEQEDHDYQNSLRYLFYGYHLPQVGDEGIQIGLINDIQSNLYVRTQFYRIISSKNGQLIQAISQQDILNIDTNVVSGIALEIQKGALKRLLPFDNLGKQFLVGSNENCFPSYNIRENIRIIPARGMKESLISFYDNILAESESEIIECLKIINRHVEKIILVGNKDVRVKYRYGTPIIRLENFSEQFPLENMGDGMTRLFHLIMALFNAKDGTLLVDEFENGLHWSILPKVWDTIFRLAEKLNVQVFATTHSRDCIQGFKQAWEQNESLGSFHRLDQDPENGAKSISYSLETLSDALDMDVEVR